MIDVVIECFLIKYFTDGFKIICLCLEVQKLDSRNNLKDQIEFPKKIEVLGCFQMTSFHWAHWITSIQALER